MPRKRRVMKQRKQMLRHQDLDIPDLLSLTCGWRPPFPWQASMTELQTLDDVREAWELNRHIFMELCTCGERRSPDCEHHALRHRPGERPWAWWKFEQGMEDSPPREEQAAILERLGELTEEERNLLAQRKP